MAKKPSSLPGSFKDDRARAFTREDSRGESVATAGSGVGRTSTGFGTIPSRKLPRSHSFIDSTHRSSIARLAKIKKVKAAYDLNTMKVFSIKQKIYAAFDPSAEMPTKAYAQVSTGIAVMVLLLIFLSVIVFSMESLPRFHNRQHPALFSIEALCTAIFTIELGARGLTTPTPGLFIRDWYNWIDFLAIFPFYLYVLIQAGGGASSQGPNTLVVLRLLRLVRVLRVLKLGQYSKPFQIVMFTLARSVMALSLLVFFLTIATVLFSSLMFICETSYGQTFDETSREWYRDDGLKSPFQSIIHVFWWAMVTLTTTGYGDAVPVTIPGKIIGGVTIVTGLFVVAFPVILISHTFQQVIEEINFLDKPNIYALGEDQQDDCHEGDSDAERPSSQKDQSFTVDSESDLDSPEMSWSRMERRSTLTLSEPPVLPALPALPSTPFDSVVCNFKWDRNGASRPIFYAGQNHIGVHVFHYHPIFQPALQTDNSSRLDAVWVEQDSVGIFIVHLKIFLDTSHARQHAAAAVERTSLYTSNVVTHARELSKVTARADLPQGCYFPLDTWYSPSGFITLNIACDTLEGLGALRLSLHSISVTFDCVFQPHRRTVDPQTILNVNTAYQNGVITSEERDVKISADIFEFTPMAVSIMLSPSAPR